MDEKYGIIRQKKGGMDMGRIEIAYRRVIQYNDIDQKYLGKYIESGGERLVSFSDVHYICSEGIEKRVDERSGITSYDNVISVNGTNEIPKYVHIDGMDGQNFMPVVVSNVQLENIEKGIMPVKDINNKFQTWYRLSDFLEKEGYTLLLWDAANSILMDMDMSYVPIAVEIDGAHGDLDDNTYDLDAVWEYLKKHPWVVKGTAKCEDSPYTFDSEHIRFSAILPKDIYNRVMETAKNDLATYAKEYRIVEAMGLEQFQLCKCN